MKRDAPAQGSICGPTAAIIWALLFHDEIKQLLSEGVEVVVFVDDIAYTDRCSRIVRTDFTVMMAIANLSAFVSSEKGLWFTVCTRMKAKLEASA